MPVAFRLLHHLPDFLDAAGDGGEGDEVALGLMGDNLRERRFAHARRPPENHRGHQIALNHAAQNLSLAEQMLLSGKFIEVLRAKAFRQRRGGIRGGQKGFLRHCSSLSFWVFCVDFSFAAVLCCRGNRACGRDKGAKKTDEVCGRPLDPFAAHTHVSWLFMLQGDSHAARLMRLFAPFRQQNPNFRHQQHQHEQHFAEQAIGAACLRNRGNAQNRQKGKQEQHIPDNSCKF